MVQTCSSHVGYKLNKELAQNFGGEPFVGQDGGWRITLILILRKQIVSVRSEWGYTGVMDSCKLWY
jgi:hypothetical protein